MKTANFRLVSPLRVDCFFLPGVEFCETAANFQFWESVATASGATHLREKPTEGKLQYGSTASVDLPHDIALLKNTVTVPTDYVHAQFPHISVTHVQWQLCDFGVLLVETFLTVDIQGREAADVEQDVQAAAAYVTSHAITENYNDLKNTIMSVDGYENFVVFRVKPQLRTRGHHVHSSSIARTRGRRSTTSQKRGWRIIRRGRRSSKSLSAARSTIPLIG